MCSSSMRHKKQITALTFTKENDDVRRWKKIFFFILLLVCISGNDAGTKIEKVCRYIPLRQKDTLSMLYCYRLYCDVSLNIYNHGCMVLNIWCQNSTATVWFLHLWLNDLLGLQQFNCIISCLVGIWILFLLDMSSKDGSNFLDGRLESFFFHVASFKKYFFCCLEVELKHFCTKPFLMACH